MQTLKIEADRVKVAMQSTSCDADDRRREPRYVPVMERAYLGWWEGDSFRTELGRLENISAGGAALELVAETGTVESVWLCVIGPNRMGWVAARLLGRQGTVARIVFAEQFPYELFKAVVWGFPAHESGPTAVLDTEAGTETPLCLETA